ncbi:MAG: hypothetical protein M1356_04650, partial [Gammaproteobacteria bacterium]|nr:hypothetical protein [Gammaproteobacteria bacterium]
MTDTAFKELISKDNMAPLWEVLRGLTPRELMKKKGSGRSMRRLYTWGFRPARPTVTLERLP